MLLILFLATYVCFVHAGGGGGHKDTSGYTIIVKKKFVLGWTSSHYDPKTVVKNFEGFGTSLSWWGNLVGGSELEETYADLFFTNEVTSLPTADGKNVTLPGLGLNIVRYNIGGTGLPGDIVGAEEKYVGNSTDPTSGSWVKEIQGYWKNWNSSDVNSSSWDWNRDKNQRSLLIQASNRYVNLIDFFSNAPMWWMTNEGTSMGGTLQSWNLENFATYVASVVDFSMLTWGVTVNTVSIMNNPSKGWWNIGIDQEGLNVPDSNTKVQLLDGVKSALASKGRSNVAVTGVDENGAVSALASYDAIKSHVDQVNVHGYENDTGAKRKFAKKCGIKTWMSQYSDSDSTGMSLAQAISSDINSMQAAAWIYWQVLDPDNGLINLSGGKYQNSTDPQRGLAGEVTTKYFVMAQYTRFILPGETIYATDDDNTVLSWNSDANWYKFVTINWGTAQFITMELDFLMKRPTLLTFTYTHTNGSANFETFDCSVEDGFAESNCVIDGTKVKYWAEANTVYSVLIP